MHLDYTMLHSLTVNIVGELTLDFTLSLKVKNNQAPFFSQEEILLRSCFGRNFMFRLFLRHIQ